MRRFVFYGSQPKKAQSLTCNNIALLGKPNCYVYDTCYAIFTLTAWNCIDDPDLHDHAVSIIMDSARYNYKVFKTMPDDMLKRIIEHGQEYTIEVGRTG